MNVDALPGAAAVRVVTRPAAVKCWARCVLAKALRDHPEPAGAFATYEQLRRDRVQANITTSARMSAPDPTKRRTAPPRSPGTRIGDLKQAV